jgi:magnesium chelatase subunit D
MSVIRPVYPFSALVGQDHLKRALLLCAINPRIGGVLIRGEKGTAKSTAVRGLAHLLPSLVTVVGCPYSCPPDKPAGMCATCRNHHSTDETLPTVTRPIRLVELPVSASEDRVVGSLDLEHAITEGQRRFEPGLLAQVNRGVLYVDEINLLDDHLVDVLLDAAAMGVNTVEREGISVSHPARFVLVGTMNPEEGELRPQLLDRFGLAVEIGGLTSVEQRVAVIERRMAYEENPDSFATRWQEHERDIAERIIAAQQVLPQVIIQPTDMAIVASLVLELGVDGHRADLTILETARTHAAWSGRTLLTTEDIRIAAELALPHRLRRQPFLETQINEQTIGETVERCSEAVRETETQQQQSDEGEKKNSSDDTVTGDQSEQGAASGGEHASTSSSSQPAQDAEQQHTNTKTHQGEDPFRVQRIESRADRTQRRSGGRRSRTRTNRKQGRYITSKRVSPVTDLAFDATLREAAPHQRQRRLAAAASGSNNEHIQRRLFVHTDDLRQKVRVRRTRNAVCFVVDASWSMAAEERMRTTKAAVFSLLRDAYQRRDLVGLVSFQRTYASVLLPLTNSVELAQKCLQTMPTGGKTPLARGILTGFEQLERARRQDPEVIPLLVLITDGQANVAIGTMKPQIEAYHIAASVGCQNMHAIVIDTEHPNFDRGLSRQLAFHLQGDYYRLDDLSGGKLVRMVREQMGT